MSILRVVAHCFSVLTPSVLTWILILVSDCKHYDSCGSQFQCTNAKCIDPIWSLFSDYECYKCCSSLFQCANNMCINLDMMFVFRLWVLLELRLAVPVYQHQVYWPWSDLYFQITSVTRVAACCSNVPTPNVLTWVWYLFSDYECYESCGSLFQCVNTKCIDPDLIFIFRLRALRELQLAVPMYQHQVYWPRSDLYFQITSVSRVAARCSNVPTPSVLTPICSVMVLTIAEISRMSRPSQVLSVAAI